jgi:hypothetical protein
MKYLAKVFLFTFILPAIALTQISAQSFAEVSPKLLEAGQLLKLTQCAQWTVLEGYLDNLLEYDVRNWVNTLSSFKKGDCSTFDTYVNWAMNSNVDLKKYKETFPDVDFEIEELDAKVIRNRIEFLMAVRGLLNPFNRQLSDRIIKRFNNFKVEYGNSLQGGNEKGKEKEKEKEEWLSNMTQVGKGKKKSKKPPRVKVTLSAEQNYTFFATAVVEEIADSLRGKILDTLGESMLGELLESEIARVGSKGKEKEKEKEKGNDDPSDVNSHVTLEDLKKHWLKEISYNVDHHLDRIHQEYPEFRVQEFVNHAHDAITLSISSMLFVKMYVTAGTGLKKYIFSRIRSYVEWIPNTGPIDLDYLAIFSSTEDDQLMVRDSIVNDMRKSARKKVLPWISGTSSLVYHSVKHPAGVFERDYFDIFEVDPGQYYHKAMELIADPNSQVSFRAPRGSGDPNLLGSFFVCQEVKNKNPSSSNSKKVSATKRIFQRAILYVFKEYQMPGARKPAWLLPILVTFQDDLVLKDISECN